MALGCEMVGIPYDGKRELARPLLHFCFEIHRVYRIGLVVTAL